MKILLIGKTGQLGTAICDNIHKFDIEIIAPDRNQLDVDIIGTVDSFVHYNKPKYVINTVAYNNTLAAETYYNKAVELNYIAVENISEICHKYGSKLITFSTDYVFDGTKPLSYDENDIPYPLQNYGKSKLAGEQAALKYPEHTVIRTCGLYGKSRSKNSKGNCVINRIKDAEKSSILEVSNEQRVCPTSAESLAIAMLELLNYNPFGLYHMVSSSSCTWFEFTKNIFEILKRTDVIINPVNRHGFSGGIYRPLNSSMVSIRLPKEIKMPHWKDALFNYLKDAHVSVSSV